MLHLRMREKSDWLNNGLPAPGRKFDLHDHATSQLKFQTSPLNLLLKHGRLTSVTLRSAILAKVRHIVSINATDAHKKANRRYRAVFAFVGLHCFACSQKSNRQSKHVKIAAHERVNERERARTSFEPWDQI